MGEQHAVQPHTGMVVAVERRGVPVTWLQLELTSEAPCGVKAAGHSAPTLSGSIYVKCPDRGSPQPRDADCRLPGAGGAAGPGRGSSRSVDVGFHPGGGGEEGGWR